MAFRAPLAPKNIDLTKTGGGPSKRLRSLVPATMDKGSLVEFLRRVNDGFTTCRACRTSISEEDITKPTTERVQMIYLMLLNVIFDIAPDALHQAPLDGFTTHYPEIYEDHHGRVGFIKSVHRLMDTCLLEENDFGPRDIVETNPKRTQKHFSAVANFIKFNDYVNKMCKTEENKLQIQDLTEKLLETKDRKSTLQQDIRVLQEKRVTEQELEEDLKMSVKEKKANLKTLEAHVVRLEERHTNGKKEIEMVQAKQTDLDEESQRLEDRCANLSNQMVTSPQELHQAVAEAHEQLNEATASTRSVTDDLGMWESLTKMASETVIEQTSEDIVDLMGKVKETDLKNKQLDQLADTKIKFTQELKQMSFKKRNLYEESRALAEERATLTRSTKCTNGHQELVSELESLHIPFEKNKLKESDMLDKLDQRKDKYAQRRKIYEELEIEYKLQANSLKDSYYKCKENTIAISNKLSTLTS